MEDGQLFRQLRQARNLSMQQVADERVSVSFISKFEQGKSRISVDRLEALLENIQVSFEEFQYLRHATTRVAVTPQDFTSLAINAPYMDVLHQVTVINHQTELPRPARIEAFTQLQASIAGAGRWQRFCRLYLELMLVVERSNLSHQNSTQPAAQLLAELMGQLQQLTIPVRRYLYQMENWGIFEILMFRIFQVSFPTEDVTRLLHTALNRSEQERGLIGIDQLRMEILFSCLSRFFNLREFAAAESTLALTADLLRDSQNLTDSLTLLFYQGWYLISTDAVASGTEKCQQAISVAHILQQPQLAQRWQAMLDKFLANRDGENYYYYFT